MKLNPTILNIKKGKLCLSFLETGDIYKISYDNTMLNMYPGSYFDGSLYNIYLKTNGKITKLIGKNSPSSLAYNEDSLFYKGEFEGVKYLVRFTIFDDLYFVDITLDGKGIIYYGMDIGLANEGTNEAYNSQYLDHHIINDDNIVILSKQNQGRPLMMESSSLDRIVSYSTDGFQFFKEEYKIDNKIHALYDKHLANENYQYEFAYLAFESEEINNKTITFYHKIKDNYHIFPPVKEDIDNIKKAHDSISMIDVNKLSFSRKIIAIDYDNILHPLDFNEDDFNKFFNEKIHLQKDEKGNILSFFNDDNSYVVTKRFEAKLKRPSAMVFIGNGFKKIDRSPFAFTSYNYGVFASHIVLGNCNFNSFTPESKTPLNIYKSKGLRIFIKKDGKYQLLAIPSIFQIRINSATWYYKFDDDIIKIESSITYDDNRLEIRLVSLNHKKYDYLVTNYVDMFNNLPVIKHGNNKLSFYFAKEAISHDKYPSLHYDYIFEDKLDLVHDDFDEYPLIANKINNKDNFTILIGASYEDNVDFSFFDIDKNNKDYYDRFVKNINSINVESNDKLTSKLNDLTIWYTHNALVHYASPHGLEQYSGAAWGFRDVLQGPFELFCVFGHYDIAKDILLKAYSRQFVHNFDWPQWFMFDEYKNIQAPDSHGDIIVWPLKALSKYLLETNDLSILDTKVTYFDFYQGKPSSLNESVLDHVKRELKAIENSFVPGFNLPSYGGGDWDDTLQPKDRNKAKRMASCWTTGLLLDALKDLIKALENSSYDLTYFKSLYDNIYADFKKYLIVDDIPAGFIYVNENNNIECIIHPNDKVSNIRYRLLPLTRGMIGRLYTEDEVNKYVDIMDKYLTYPDGVRLMSDAIFYNAGYNRLFKRAETASNFGREIGLQYVHSNIRYMEAMATIGDNQRLYDSANKIIPIGIVNEVLNATYRQENTYFSSSDGLFINRYDACKNFDKLKDGTVKVAGGWRLYSSGPGIFLQQIYTKMFGLKILNKELYLDPIMLPSQDGTKISFDKDNKHFEIHYHIKNNKNTIKYLVINGKRIEKVLKETYRNGGIIIPANTLNDNNLIEVYCM